MAGERRVIKCEGRFGDLRTFLYEEAMPAVLGAKTKIERTDLRDMWELIEGDIPSKDPRDPYFNSRVDTLRRQPSHDYLGLVPLIAHSEQFHLDEELVRDYALSMGNHAALADKLAAMNSQPRRLLHDIGGREERKIQFPDGGSLAGYVVAGNFGIGTVSPGGVQGGGIRSDSPFLIEVYKTVRAGGQDLVAVVGYWPQDNAMVVSQMQSCRNAQFPEDLKFGVACLHTAEVVARAMGFREIATYGAREHPMFKEHPDSWRQIGADFVCMYDSSAKRLGFNGSRGSHHAKSLVA